VLAYVGSIQHLKELKWSTLSPCSRAVDLADKPVPYKPHGTLPWAYAWVLDGSQGDGRFLTSEVTDEGP